MSYEINVYATQADFDNRQPTQILDDLDLETEDDALAEGRLWLSDHEVVKVQSYDREFIQVLTRADYPQAVVEGLQIALSCEPRNSENYDIIRRQLDEALARASDEDCLAKNGTTDH